MMRLIFVGLMISTVATASENANPGFNFEGVEAFWEVVGILEADQARESSDRPIDSIA